MKSAHTILVAILLGTVHSYLLRSRTFTTLSPIARWQRADRNERWTTRLGANNDGFQKETKDNNSSLQWELMEDWILQDKVPEFTVRGSTFWRQLKHTIPELSSRSEQQLQERYKQISSKEFSNDDNNNKSNGTPFVECGDSPEVLSTWWMDVVGTNSAAVMMMHGRLSNGSNIWFPLQSAGTVGGNHNVDDTSFRWLLEDGDFTKYVESSAGCIYELGTPKPNSMDTLFASTTDESTTNTNILGLNPSNEPLTNPTANLGTAISAAIASSILSAFLAFNLGQSSLPKPAPTPTPVTTTAIVKRQSPSVQAVTPAVLGSGMKYERTLQKDGSVNIVEMSIGEQRASQELKIFRQERRITTLQDKLETDKRKLRELSQQEAALGPEAAAKPLVDGLPKSPRELSISEQRARAEIKVGMDQRQLQRTKENQGTDLQKLKELQAQEKQQQRQQLFSWNGK